MSAAAIHYRIWPYNPEAHLFRVTLTVAEPAGEQTVSLPSWIPGSYLVREFSKNIVRIWGEMGGQPHPLQRVDKHTWTATDCTGPLTIHMEVYAWDLSVRTAHLDQTHGFFNGTSTFLKVHGQEHTPCQVTIEPPTTDYGSTWKLATAMRRLDGETWGFGTFEVGDYDELIDHPVEMGTFESIEFEACGTPHAIVLTGRFTCDWDRLVEDVKAICESQIRMFGEPAPMDRYLFMTMVVGDGYGGLEHRWSTALICRRESLPQPHADKMTDGYRTFLGLVSHEYFHSWNVKRIKPAVFTPYDLSKESYTTLLWAFEGITSYYDDLMLLRSGRIQRKTYLEVLGQTATRVWRTPGRSVQTVTDSSYDAWTKFYRQDENAQNAIVSYYTKGALVALCLDLTIRRETAGVMSLDDVMLALWERHGETGVGVDERGIERLAQEVTGLDLSEFFERALYTTEELPVAECLADFGLTMRYRSANASTDKGGTKGKESAIESMSLGAHLVSVSGGVKVSRTLLGGPAQLSGLAARDVIVAFDGLKATKDRISQALKGLSAGQQVKIHAFRRDELIETVVAVEASPQTTIWFETNDEASDVAVALRDAWLT